MGVLARAITYATLYIGFFLVYLPARILDWSGIQVPADLGPRQLVGLGLSGAGALLAITCILTFVFRGHGTPAPFDPPRRLVQRGPYRFIRNPMYLGAGLAMLGAGVYYGSWAIVIYVAVFMVGAHALVRLYEEPALRRQFGTEYEAYCAATPRWLPIRRPHPPRPASRSA
ncbi:MAG TPA: isoprenylcysteine carboxylmethyltransferase family protein [Gemmatimonadales bacterium]|nr:isoprenylcysteine carboxylmethyltransferase family protein [Gemmatimonadales bacterium]